MIIPIRCFTCGKIIAHLWELYKDLKEKHSSSTEEKISEELNKKLKLERYCCKRMLITHVEIVDDLLKYDKKENIAL